MTIKDKVIIQMLKEIAVTQLLVTITMALPSLLTVSLYEHWNDLLIIIIFLLNVIEGAMLYFLYGYKVRH